MEIIEKLGSKVINFFQFLGSIAVMSGKFFLIIGKLKFEFHQMMKQLYIVGIQALPLTIIIGTAIGMVITLQFAYGLGRYGLLDNVPKLVAIAISRELGPVFIALLVGGKIASGFASELGSMKVGEQIDAIRSLGADPIQKLVVPRVLAVILVLPLLTILADLLSFVGGSIIGYLEYGIDPETFFIVVKKSLKNREVLHSLVKSFIFGFQISIIGCTNGFKTGYGTEAVGKSTTETVQMAFIFIVITNFLLSKLFMVVKLTYLDTGW